MKKIYYLLIALVMLAILPSCDEEVDINPESVLYTEKSYENEFDKWIVENFTDPYNIEVKWKWDDNELDNNFWLTPPQQDKAKDFLQAMLDIWIKPYAEEGGPNFIETYIPKILVLVGTPQYNKDGSMTLGLAEGGKKVTIFNIDKFDITNRKSVIKAFHTMHHEFGHIMHQTTFYPLDFKNITKGDYSAGWIDVKDLDANVQGYITPYSMLNEDEDFVELIASILTTVDYSNEKNLYSVPKKDDKGFIIKSKPDGSSYETAEMIEKEMTSWEHRLYMLGIEGANKWNYNQDKRAPEGIKKLNSKIHIITSYFKNIWKIDLYNLQKRIDIATKELIEKNKE